MPHEVRVSLAICLIAILACALLLGYPTLLVVGVCAVIVGLAAIFGRGPGIL